MRGQYTEASATNGTGVSSASAGTDSTNSAHGRFQTIALATFGENVKRVIGAIRAGRTILFSDPSSRRKVSRSHIRRAVVLQTSMKLSSSSPVVTEGNTHRVAGSRTPEVTDAATQSAADQPDGSSGCSPHCMTRRTTTGTPFRLETFVLNAESRIAAFALTRTTACAWGATATVSFTGSPRTRKYVISTWACRDSSGFSITKSVAKRRRTGPTPV